MTRPLDYYARPSGVTAAGGHAARLKALPGDVGALVRIVQGLVVYDVVAAEFYGFTIPRARQAEIQHRSVEAMLDRLVAMDDRPLAVARPVARRLVGRCHHFALLLVGMLRAQGLPARARCGFGAYFNPPFYEDHWVCEWWDVARRNRSDRRPGPPAPPPPQGRRTSKRKSQCAAPCMMVFVRVSRMSGLKPSTSEKSRLHESRAPTSGMPRLRYISA